MIRDMVRSIRTNTARRESLAFVAEKTHYITPIRNLGFIYDVSYSLKYIKLV